MNDETIGYTLASPNTTGQLGSLMVDRCSVTGGLEFRTVNDQTMLTYLGIPSISFFFFFFFCFLFFFFVMFFLDAHFSPKIQPLKECGFSWKKLASLPQLPVR